MHSRPTLDPETYAQLRSVRTVYRNWRFAKAFLSKQLGND
jgi:hypothetical protein